MIETPNIFTDTRYEARLVIHPQTSEGEWEAICDEEGNPITGDDFHYVLERASEALDLMQSEGSMVDIQRIYIAVVTTTCVPAIHFEKPDLNSELDWIGEYRKLTNTDYKTAKAAYAQRKVS
jgi:hypothetical protein